MYSLQLGFGRKRRWSRHQPARRRGKVIPQCRDARWCQGCGFNKENGLCACSFTEMDPFQPASAVLAVTPLAPSNCGQGSFAELELSAWPQLGKGEGVELRMSPTSHPGHHLWPHSMCVLLDGRELARVNPPENQRRPDSPLKLQPPDKAGGHVFQLFAGGKPPGSMSSASEDFVLCLVVTQKRRSVADLLDDCRQRPAIPAGVSTQLLTELRCAEVGVRSNTPWQQPLRCPLTQERLVEPARGMHCQHLQCFELEAFLITAAAMPFQRRWRCPICDAQLRPAQVAICEMTRRFLRELPAEASLAPLEASAASAGQVAASNTCDLTAEPAVPVPVHVAKSARMQRGHWGRRLRCEVQQGKELD